MPCHNCRSPIGEIDRFCPECGTPVGIESYELIPPKHIIWFGNRFLKVGWTIVIFACLGSLSYFLSNFLSGAFKPFFRTLGLMISIPGIPLMFIITPLNLIFSVLRFKSLDRTAKLLFFVYSPAVLIILATVAIPTLLAFVNFMTGGLFLGF